MSLTDGAEVALLAAIADAQAEYVATLPAYVPRTPASDDVGSDISCTDDVDELWSEVPGKIAFVQALVRRLVTPHGALFDDPEYGLDLRAYLHRGLTPAQVGQIPVDVVAELKKDERVASVDVRVASFTGEVFTLEVRVTPVDPAVGSLQFVLDVTDAAVLLKEVA